MVLMVKAEMSSTSRWLVVGNFPAFPGLGTGVHGPQPNSTSRLQTPTIRCDKQCKHVKLTWGSFNRI